MVSTETRGINNGARSAEVTSLFTAHPVAPPTMTKQYSEIWLVGQRGL